MKKKFILYLFLLINLNQCNTVTGTVEGTALGVVINYPNPRPLSSNTKIILEGESVSTNKKRKEANIVIGIIGAGSWGTGSRCN